VNNTLVPRSHPRCARPLQYLFTGIDDTRGPFKDRVTGQELNFKDLIYNESVVCGNNFLSRMQVVPNPEFVDCAKYEGRPGAWSVELDSG
jgi:hypothetical protein